MRKFLVQLEGSQEEAKAESPQQLALQSANVA